MASITDVFKAFGGKLSQNNWFIIVYVYGMVNLGAYVFIKVKGSHTFQNYSTFNLLIVSQVSG